MKIKSEIGYGFEKFYAELFALEGVEIEISDVELDSRVHDGVGDDGCVAVLRRRATDVDEVHEHVFGIQSERAASIHVLPLVSRGVEM